MFINSIMKKIQKYDGFSLLELSVVLVLVGSAIAAIAPVYQQKIVKDRFEETQDNLFTVQKAVGSFRSVYGRYPCPSSSTAAPGDAPYGLEECGAALAPNTCGNGVCKYASNIPGRNVIVGSVPWKILSTQEFEAHDLYLNRLTYAVTEDLTDSTTFDLTSGGIGIVDDSGNSMIEDVDEAHFIVVMHGSNGFGARSKVGSVIAPCTGGSLAEQENCDADSVFVSIEVNDDFDDRVGFFSSVRFAEWQRSAAEPTNVHLKNANSVSIGATISDNLGGEEALTTKVISADTGNIRADIAVHASRICKDPIPPEVFDPNIHCFSPSLIGGLLTDSVAVPGEKYSDLGKGMSCFDEADPTTNDRFLTGIQNRSPICVDEVFQSCPLGFFVKGIDANHVVECAVEPEEPCPDSPQTTICGDVGVLSATASSLTSVIYSGECNMITDYDSSYFTANYSGLTLAQMRDDIAIKNAETRTVDDCGSSPSTALIRDNYMCTNGTWNYLSSHEKLQYYRAFTDASYPDPHVATNSSYNAEIGGGFDSTTDPSNTGYNHDCWCREDYRVTETNTCPAGGTGTVIRVQKYICPSTYGSWRTIYTDDDTNCACVPEDDAPVSQTCNNYLDELNGDPSGTTSGLNGSVIKYYDTVCVAGVPTTTLDSVDISGCSCAAQPDVHAQQACPFATTNQWTLPGVGVLNDVERYTIQSWTCPGGTTTGGLPNPGSLGAPVDVGSPTACTCDNITTGDSLACPPGQGGLIFYEKEWDCTASPADWEPESEWTETSRTCNSCGWVEPPGAGISSDYQIGKQVSGTCACGASPGLCYRPTGTNYEYWSGCQCEVMP